MNEPIKTAHIALQYHDKKEAETFFCSILGLNKEREFKISADMANSIFGISKEVDVAIYSNETISFEIFFTEEKPKVYYEHICIKVGDKDKLISMCRKYGILVKIIRKGDRDLLFIRDFSGYLYEIKEIKMTPT